MGFFATMPSNSYPRKKLNISNLLEIKTKTAECKAVSLSLCHSTRLYMIIFVHLDLAV